MLRSNGSLGIVAMALATTGCMPEDGAIGWSFEGLADLGNDYVYEAWLIVDDEPISAGRFSVGSSGDPDVALGVVPGGAPDASAFVLTIEPAADDDAGPSTSKLLGGDFADGAVDLAVDHPAALGDDFSAATGRYVLSTPTTASIDDDWARGIWWVDPSAGPGPGLDLPSLPPGFVYEGWVVDGYGATSTGRFSDPSAADMDGPGPSAGSDAPPPLPGQDFITPPLYLVGLTAVISVEPEPDNAPTPFSIKPLVDAIEDFGAGVTQDMSTQDTNPTGSAWFE